MDKLLSAFAAILEYFQASRLSALTDKSAWLLIAPAIAALYTLDAAMATTLLQWGVFGLVLAGVSIIISRMVFPQVRLTALVESAHQEKNTAAGLVVAATIVFVGLVMLALVMWAKA